MPNSDDVQDIFIGQSRDAHIRLEERTNLLLEIGREHDGILRRLPADVDAAHQGIRQVRKDIAELEVFFKMLMSIQGVQGIALVVLIVIEWKRRS